MSVVCPYCGCDAVLEDSSVVYGRSYGMIWRCAPCNAYVGCHKNSKDHKPLGRLANSELRSWKIRCHDHFDRLWKSGQRSRSSAYRWLADQMNLPIEECHIAMFDVAQCEQAISIITEGALIQ